MGYEATVWHAAKMGQIDLLKKLIEQDGHSFYKQDDQLKTPFYYGCTFNQPYVLAYLSKLYDQHNITMPAEQRSWCIVSCLNKDVRLFLEGKLTIESVIASRKKKAHDESLSAMQAAQEGNTTRLRYYIKFEPENLLEKPPLQAACIHNQAIAVAMLLQFYKLKLNEISYQQLIQESMATTSSETIQNTLQGKLSLKELCLLEKNIPMRQSKLKSYEA
ncbi:hypothetical protein THRCLA_05210 [Thraustotheca clavata]|uniref:Uncharacterized protein n=1 Tax=Thraustotheca clavata TaxID=74557 RepID=A0A1V9ZWL9_9STRA|nr:hypothetical protein THRCLA_05210 [Thraustotheca clavata]